MFHGFENLFDCGERRRRGARLQTRSCAGGHRAAQMRRPAGIGLVHQAIEQAADAGVARADGIDDFNWWGGLVKTLSVRMQFRAFGAERDEYDRLWIERLELS